MDSAKIFARGAVKLVALVLVAGGVGLALGRGLSALSQDELASDADRAPQNSVSDPTAAASAVPAAAGSAATRRRRPALHRPRSPRSA